ncbi:MAG: hypothetical protein Q7R47_05105, partial [Candidatus Diapherotrites archaeon]|nr:hypothetical protein [Candidatus Diapherotrites archaeon]
MDGTLVSGQATEAVVACAGWSEKVRYEWRSFQAACAKSELPAHEEIFRTYDFFRTHGVRRRHWVAAARYLFDHGLFRPEFARAIG